jgi:hypothetical protein
MSALAPQPAVPVPDRERPERRTRPRPDGTGTRARSKLAHETFRQRQQQRGTATRSGRQRYSSIGAGAVLGAAKTRSSTVNHGAQRDNQDRSSTAISALMGHWSVYGMQGSSLDRLAVPAGRSVPGRGGPSAGGVRDRTGAQGAAAPRSPLANNAVVTEDGPHPSIEVGANGVTRCHGHPRRPCHQRAIHNGPGRA